MEEITVDPELDEIRSKRMAEMQQQQKGGENQKNAQEAAAREEEMKNAMLSQVLDQNARARLSNIAVAKPEKAKKVENMIINMARFGQIAGKLSDDQLKQILDKISEQTQKNTTVKFDRRPVDSDEED